MTGPAEDMAAQTPAVDREVAGIVDGKLKSLIGRSSGEIAMSDPVAGSDIRRFLEATGDSNPLWADDDFARAHGYPGRVVPPEMLIELCLRPEWNPKSKVPVFWHNIPFPPAYTDTRNAGVEAEWFTPVCVGERLSFEHRILDIAARRARAGPGIYVSRESVCRNGAGTTVMRLVQTIVKLPTQPPD